MKEATKMRGVADSMLFSVFWAFGLVSIPTPLMDGFVLFFLTKEVIRVHPLPTS